MAKFNILFVEPYRGGHRYRRRVPKNVRGKIGKGSWTHNFPPRAPFSVIEREAKRLAILHDREITIARGQEIGLAQIEEAEAFARELLAGDRRDVYSYLELATQEELSPQTAAIVSALEHGGRVVSESLSLTVALQRDIEVYGGERDEKPARYAMASFVDMVGDKGITVITRADVSEWIAAQAKGRLAPATIKRRLGALRALLNRQFLDMDYPGRNPFEKQPIKGGNGGASDMLPFNKVMLARIDSHLNIGKRVFHETKNILRVMRNTGAGPGEVGGLAVADVSLDSEIPYIWIRPNAHRGVKASARDRQIPLIGVALEAAQDAYKRALARAKGGKKNTDTVPLFEDFGMNGRGADAISRKCNVCIRASGVPKSPRLVAYSFRHCLKEALRLAGTPDHVQRRLMGHAGAGVADRYGSPRLRLAEARDAIVAAMEHLGDVDHSIYSEAERL